MQDSSCLGSGLRLCQCFLGSLPLCGCQPDLPHSLFQISYGLSHFRPLSHWRSGKTCRALPPRKGFYGKVLGPLHLFGAAMWLAWLLEAEEPFPGVMGTGKGSRMGPTCIMQSLDLVWSEYDKDNCDNGSGLKLYHPWNIDLRQATFLPSYFCHLPSESYFCRFQSCHFAHLNTIVKVLIETKHLLQSLELGGLTTNLDK